MVNTNKKNIRRNSGFLASENPVRNVDKKRLTGPILNSSIENEIWKKFHDDNEFKENGLFRGETRGNFLYNDTSQRVISEISKTISDNYAPPLAVMATESIYGCLPSVFNRNLDFNKPLDLLPCGNEKEQIERDSAVGISEVDDYFDLLDHKRKKIQDIRYIPNGFNKSFVVNINSFHFSAVNMRRSDDRLVFSVSDSLNTLYSDVKNGIDKVVNKINKNRENFGFKPFIATTIFLECEQKQQVGEKGMNSCAIWSAINAVDMQQIPNDKFFDSLPGNVISEIFREENQAQDNQPKLIEIIEKFKATEKGRETINKKFTEKEIEKELGINKDIYDEFGQDFLNDVIKNIELANDKKEAIKLAREMLGIQEDNKSKQR